MKSFLVLATLLAVTLSIPATADAGLFRRGGGSIVSAAGEYVATAESTDKIYDGGTLSLQDVAQARADAMARIGRMTHSIHQFASVKSYTAVAVAEGIGMGGGSDHKRVATCICGRRIVADAWAKAKNGTIYRVRFFRN